MDVISKEFGYKYSTSNERLTVIIDCRDSFNSNIIEGMKAYSSKCNYVIMTPSNHEITINAILLGSTITDHMCESNIEHTIPKDLLISRLCLAKCIGIMEKRLSLENIYMGEDNIGGREKLECRVLEAERCSVRDTNDPVLCVCVGAGGTGGNLIKVFSDIMLRYPQIELLIIDGDRVEAKNMTRQPFAKHDILQYKAEVLTTNIKKMRPTLSERLFYQNDYIDTVNDLREAVQTYRKDRQLILMIGCVDNHRARQVMEKFFHLEDTIVYVDTANEWSHGETVISIKKNKEMYSPLRSYYYKEVLTDNSPSASEVSCGTINETSPQHLITNLTSAQNVMAAISSLFIDGTIQGGISYFDSFKYFGRFQPVMIGEENRCGNK